MKAGLFRCLLLVSLSFSFSAVAGSLSQYLPDVEPREPGLICPGTSIVFSCGNRRCDTGLGETVETCPEDCVSAKVESYNRQTMCRKVQHVYRPTTVSAAQDAIREAVQNSQRIKVVGQAHSASDTICTYGVVVSTENLRQIIGIETYEGQETVLLEAGVKLHELTEWLHERDRSIGFALMGFNGVSIAGAVATGSHGSSPKHDAIISSKVVAMEVIGPDGELREYSKASTDPNTWKAMTASLGLLGMTARMRLAVEPQFNLDVEVSYHDEATLFEQDGVFNQVADCDWGQLNWFPGNGTFMRSCGRITDKPAEAGAHNSLLQPNVTAAELPAAKLTMQLAACDRNYAKKVEKTRLDLFRTQPPFKKNHPLFGTSQNVHEAIGPSHRMQSSYLTAVQDGLFQMDWEIVVPVSRVDEAMRAVKTHLNSHNISVPLIGVFIRFAQARSDSLLAHTVTGGEFGEGETVVFIEIPIFMPSAFPPAENAWYQYPYQEFTRLLVEDFGGRAHWGKNRGWVFDLQNDQGKYGDLKTRFIGVVEQFDPFGVFANDFGRQLGVNWPRYDESFADFYFPQTPAQPCGCPSTYEPVCERNTEQTLTNRCLATCETGIISDQLLDGQCSDYRFVDWGLWKQAWKKGLLKMSWRQ
ncbi:hypothetical protein GCM10023116_35100 [Kistimonas scapharcae]|uniref:FAD-binding PCMH-type domain-containing protein n=1 Tax=Kistimonas scapharcae TaxID=1036133 RepID=A0ABP8V8E7_9GAMM